MSKRDRSPSRDSLSESYRSRRNLDNDRQFKQSLELPTINLGYKFGDAGSNWRMIKYKRTLEAINEHDNGKSKLEIIVQRYGSEVEFDIAKQEREELDRRSSKPKSEWIYAPLASVQQMMKSATSTTDISLNELVQQERNYARSFSKDSAKAILNDSQFEDSLEYQDEKATKLSDYVKSGKISTSQLENPQRLSKIMKNLAKCELCNKTEILPISMGQHTYLTLLPYNSYNKLYPSNTTVICLNEHHNNTLHCDDEEWDEIENFFKTLATFYYKEYKRGVIFIEDAVDDGKYQRNHAHILAIPIPITQFNQARGFFKQGILSNSNDLDENSYRTAVIDTQAKSRELGSRRRQSGFKQLISKEAPYYHTWFNLDGGIGHVIEDIDNWPKYDLFTRQIVGEGLLKNDDPILVNSTKNYKKWVSSAHKGEEKDRVDRFRKKWNIYDWTQPQPDSPTSFK